MRTAGLPNQREHKHTRRATTRGGAGGCCARRNRGFVLVASLLILLGLTSLVGVGLTRSLTEVSAANRLETTSQAFHAAEAGMDELLQCLNKASCVSDSWQLQHDMLDGLNNASGPQLPANAPSPFPKTAAAARDLLETPAGTLRYTWCQPSGTVVDDRYFPVCVKGVAPGMALTDTSPEIETVVELPPSTGTQGAGAMVLSKITIGEGTEINGDVVLLSHGDRKGSVTVGKGAKVHPAENGAGGRILIRDYPNKDLDLSTTVDWRTLSEQQKKTSTILPGILDDSGNPLLNADGTQKRLPALTGWSGNAPFPVVSQGDDVKDIRDKAAVDLDTYGGIRQGTLADFIKPFITTTNPNYTLFDKLTTLNKLMKDEEIASVERFSRVRTKPDWNNTNQIPHLTIKIKATASGFFYDENGLFQSKDVNNGEWRITQPPANQKTEVQFALVKSGTDPVYFKKGQKLPAGVWVLQSLEVGKQKTVAFDGPTRVYLTGNTKGGDALNVHETQTKLLVGDGTNPDNLQIIVPCLERAGGKQICDTMDDSGVCKDTGTGNNPDEAACATQNTARLYVGKGATISGSIHAPTNKVRLFENATVQGDYIVADELEVGKHAEFHSPEELQIPDGSGGAAKKVTLKLWQGR